MIKAFIDWYLTALADGGYLLVALLMAVESSVVPLPSELVIPPAAHLAVTTGRLSLTGIVAAAAVGSWVGASLMYLLARWLGRPLVQRFGPYVFISETKLAAAERWAASFGTAGVFAARLLPVIRHLIGLPAGLVKMSYLRYSVATLIGSALWSAVLVAVGLAAGSDERLLAGDLHRVTLWLVGGLAVLGSLYWFFVHRPMQAKR
jgi:membrane protein DedA with SNARE-associated domain